jgi:putative SOS response-associated peptidase YedK
MPVILNPDSYDLWLDPGMQNVAEASELLKPFDARLMSVLSGEHADQPRGKRRRRMLEALEVAQIQNRLFSL